MAYCTKCAAALDEGAQFCTSCGSSVVPGAPAGPAGPNPVAPAAAAGKAAVEWFGQDNNRDLRTLLVSLGAVLALAFALGAFGQSTPPALAEGGDLLVRIRDEAQANSCYASQRTIEGAASSFYASESRQPIGADELRDKGYLKKVPKCPSGAKYEYETGDGGYFTVYCPKHDGGE